MSMQEIPKWWTVYSMRTSEELPTLFQGVTCMNERCAACCPARWSVVWFSCPPLMETLSNLCATSSDFVSATSKVSSPVRVWNAWMVGMPQVKAPRPLSISQQRLIPTSQHWPPACLHTQRSASTLTATPPFPQDSCPHHCSLH